MSKYLIDGSSHIYSATSSLFFLMTMNATTPPARTVATAALLLIKIPVGITPDLSFV
jgi:hypothetical protein